MHHRTNHWPRYNCTGYQAAWTNCSLLTLKESLTWLLNANTSGQPAKLVFWGDSTAQQLWDNAVCHLEAFRRDP